MERKYYSSKDMKQRTQEWFVARMAKFTSSEISTLFAEPTQKKRALAAIEAIKTGDWKGVSLHKFTDDKQINFALKYLGVEDAKERNKFREEIKGGKGLSKTSEKAIQFHNAYNELHCFSQGAEDFIWDKALDFVFPGPEVKPQTHSMQRGEELEPMAKNAYFRRFKNLEAIDISFVEFGENAASSPDQLVKEKKLNQKGGAEFKCRERKAFGRVFKYLKTAQDVHEYHNKEWWQCHHQIWVCGLDWIDYVHYHDAIDFVYDPIQNKQVASAYQHKCLHVVRIHREESIIKQFEKVIPLAAQLRDEYLKELLK